MFFKKVLNYSSESDEIINSRKELFCGIIYSFYEKEFPSDNLDEMYVYCRLFIKRDYPKLFDSLPKKYVFNRIFKKMLKEDADLKEIEVLKKPKVLKNETLKKPKVLKNETLKEPKVLKDETLKEPKVLKNETLKEPKVLKDETQKEPKILTDEDFGLDLAVKCDSWFNEKKYDTIKIYFKYIFNTYVFKHKKFPYKINIFLNSISENLSVEYHIWSNHLKTGDFLKLGEVQKKKICEFYNFKGDGK